MSGDEDDALIQTTPCRVSKAAPRLVFPGLLSEPEIEPVPVAEPPQGESVFTTHAPAPRSDVAAPPEHSVYIAPDSVSQKVVLLMPVLVQPAPPRRALRAGAQRDVARGGYFERRLLALALLTVVVAAQPWWWNLGDIRPHRPVATRTAPASR
jgi:hypothetical protein